MLALEFGGKGTRLDAGDWWGFSEHDMGVTCVTCVRQLGASDTTSGSQPNNETPNR